MTCVGGKAGRDSGRTGTGVRDGVECGTAGSAACRGTVHMEAPSREPGGRSCVGSLGNGTWINHPFRSGRRMEDRKKPALAVRRERVDWKH